MIRPCLLLAMAATLAGAEQPTLPPQLTLAQALDIALQNSTNIRTAMAQLTQASGQYEQSRSPLLPQLDVKAHQDYLTVNLAGLGFLVPGKPNGRHGPFAPRVAGVSRGRGVLNLAHIGAGQVPRSVREPAGLVGDNGEELVAVGVLAPYLEALKAK